MYVKVNIKTEFVLLNDSINAIVPCYSLIVIALATATNDRHVEFEEPHKPFFWDLARRV